MPTLTRDDLTIHYELHGQATDRPPLLLSHGYGASGGMWEPNISALDGDRQVITWDLPGHGASDAPDRPAEYTHQACVEDMAALLDAVEAEQAVLGGMSLGGFLSLTFRLRYPERVLGLVLVDTGPGFRDEAARERWNRWARDRAEMLEADGVAALPGGPEQGQATHVHGGKGLAHAARKMLVQYDSGVFDSLHQVSVPTLIVVGSEDENFLGAADVMARRIPGAQRLVLENAGHAANLEAPEEFNAAVSRFLEAV